MRNQKRDPRGVRADRAVLDQVRELAWQHKRSLSQEVSEALRHYVAQCQELKERKGAA